MAIKKTADKLMRWLIDKAPYIIIILFVMGLGIVFNWHRIVITIHSGEMGVLYRLFLGGTVIDRVYPEGVHIIFPFDTMTIYNTRIQIIDHEFSVLTNSGLPVILKIVARYRPEIDLLGVLHQEVGPDYPYKIILPQIESVLRKGLGVRSAEDVYTNKDRLLNKLIAEAIEEVGRKFIVVDEIIIRSVDLPDSIKVAIESKLEEEQKFLAYKYILDREREEAERKRIEAGGINDYHNIILKNLNSVELLALKGIEATLKLSESENAKVVIIGGGKEGLPVILNTDDSQHK